MKASSHWILPVLLAILLSGCMPPSAPAVFTQAPTATFTPAPTATATVAPTQTPIPSPTPTATVTLVPTLKPEQAIATVKAQLSEPVECDSPCFWGIVPGQTTFTEAKNILAHLGLELLGENATFGSGIDLGGRRWVGVKFNIFNDVVRSLKAGFDPREQKMGPSRDWIAYSPESIIRRYGQPSRVDVDYRNDIAGAESFDMVLYFDAVDVIIKYYTKNSPTSPSIDPSYICPLRDSFDDVRLWIGKPFIDPPSAFVPLEDATSLTLESFSELMTDDPEQACFDLKVDAFP